MSYHFGMGNHVEYSVVDGTGRARRREQITVGGSPMMHDFSLTAGRVIFYDLPVVFDPSVVAAPPASPTPGIRAIPRASG